MNGAARRTRHAGLLAAALLLLPPLALRHSWPPDETRYAVVAQAVSREGAWVVPRLLGEPYAEKPPVFFWLAAGLAALGVPWDRAPRVVSTLSGLGCVALLPGVAAALGAPAGVAAAAALVLATTPLFLVHVQLGMLDGPLCFFVLLAIAAKCARGRPAPAGRSRRRAGWIALETLALGAALLTKGPVALLFPLGLRVGALAAPRDSPARADAGDLVALAGAVALAGIWLAAAAAEAGAGYARAISLGQVVSRVEGDVPHPALPGELWLTGLVWLAPWSLYALRQLRRPVRSAAGPALAPLAGWLGVPALVLGLLPSQQVQYLLPAAPALAALAAAAALAAPAPRLAAGVRALAGGLGVALVVAGVALPYVLPADPAPGGLGQDLALRALGVLFGGLLVSAALLPAARLRGLAGALALPVPLVRGALGAALVFGAALAVVARADPTIAGIPLLDHPALHSAPRVMAPDSLRTAVALHAGRADVDDLDKDRLLDAWRDEPGGVALVWADSLERVTRGDPRRAVVVARGRVRGRLLLLLRPAPDAAAAGPAGGGGAQPPARFTR